MIQPSSFPNQNDPFVVEVWGKLAGVVLKEGDSFRFHAVAPPFLVLDGAAFAKPGLARLAAARLDSGRAPGDGPARTESGTERRVVVTPRLPLGQ